MVMDPLRVLFYIGRVKKEIINQRVDHLSKLIIGEGPIGVNDDLLDAYLFNVEMILDWSRNVEPFFTIGKLRLNDSLERNLSMVEKSREYSMISRRL